MNPWTTALALSFLAGWCLSAALGDMPFKRKVLFFVGINLLAGAYGAMWLP